MDLLTDVLSNLWLRGEMYFRTEFAGTWAVEIPADRYSIRFHLVVQGECWVTVDRTRDPLHLREGDFVLIPHGASQTLASSNELSGVPLDELLKSGALGDDQVLRYGRGESARQTQLVCGFCRFDEGVNHPLFFGLPPILVMGRNFTGTSPWLVEAVRVIAMEADLHAIGGSAVISRLMEVVFIQGIRHQFTSGANPSIPYLAAITDNKLKVAIEAMHSSPEKEWTLTKLAQISGMSRGRFAQRFKETIGQSPMTYLTNWRLQKARRMLKQTNLSIAEIGYSSGYRSLPSFTRRFGKQFGISPGAFRKLPQD